MCRQTRIPAIGEPCFLLLIATLHSDIAFRRVSRLWARNCLCVSSQSGMRIKTDFTHGASHASDESLYYPYEA